MAMYTRGPDPLSPVGWVGSRDYNNVNYYFAKPDTVIRIQDLLRTLPVAIGGKSYRYDDRLIADTEGCSVVLSCRIPESSLIVRSSLHIEAFCYKTIRRL